MKLKFCFRGIFLSKISRVSAIYLTRKACFGGTAVLGFTLFFSFCGSCSAQDIKPLKIGDTLPDITVSKLVNSNDASIKLSSFRGKVLIIDFWATNCTSCLEHFPVADSIQKNLGSKVRFLLVDSKTRWESKQKILNTITGFTSSANGFSLPATYDDTVLTRLFPHYYIPHYVWIDPNGVFRATTGEQELTQQNVSRFLKNYGTTLRTKRDFDPDRPLFTSTDLPIDSLKAFSIFLRGDFDGIGGGGYREINGKVRGLILHNRSLFDMYSRIKDHEITGYSENRILLQVKEPARLMYIKGTETIKEWRQKNLYSYELIVPENEVRYLYDDALRDLDRYTDYTAIFKYLKEPCWVLSMAHNPTIPQAQEIAYNNKLDDATDARIMGGGITDICEFLNKLGDNKVIVIDETGYTGALTIDFKRPVKDIRTLQRLLPAYGFRLQCQTKTVKMMVVRDKS